MLKVRLLPTRNLGCVGIYSNLFSIDVFRRPYLGCFIRFKGTKCWVSLLPWPRIAKVSR